MSHKSGLEKDEHSVMTYVSELESQRQFRRKVVSGPRGSGHPSFDSVSSSTILLSRAANWGIEEPVYVESVDK